MSKGLHSPFCIEPDEVGATGQCVCDMTWSKESLFEYQTIQNRCRELEAQEKAATDFIVRVLEAIDIDVPKPCDEVISLEIAWYQVLGHIEGLKGEVTDLEAENARLNMEMVSYREKLTPKDVEAMTAVIKALNDEKAARSASIKETNHE